MVTKRALSIRITRNLLRLTGDKPHVLVKGCDTKNSELAKQYIQQPLAAELAIHVSTKPPKAPVFNMPRLDDVAGMLRTDLARARLD